MFLSETREVGGYTRLLGGVRVPAGYVAGFQLLLRRD
jgi:hypothetical protein